MESKNYFRSFKEAIAAAEKLHQQYHFDSFRITALPNGLVVLIATKEEDR